MSGLKPSAEIEYQVKESIIKELRSYCKDIAYPTVKYQKNQIGMAQDVISGNSMNAQTMLSIIDEIKNC